MVPDRNQRARTCGKLGAQGWLERTRRTIGMSEEERKANTEEKAGASAVPSMEILFTIAAAAALLHLLTNGR
jgi:hypothetical protein